MAPILLWNKKGGWSNLQIASRLSGGKEQIEIMDSMVIGKLADARKFYRDTQKHRGGKHRKRLYKTKKGIGKSPVLADVEGIYTNTPL